MRHRFLLTFVASVALLPVGVALDALMTREDVAMAWTAAAPDVKLARGAAGVTLFGASFASASTNATMVRVGDVETLSVLRGVSAWSAQLTLVNASGYAVPDNVSLVLVGATNQTQVVVRNGTVTQTTGSAVALAATGPDLSLRANGTCAATCRFSTLLTLRPAGATSPIVSYAYDLIVVSPRGPAPVSLGTASGYAILAKSGITTTGATSIVGDIGVSPIASGAMTGFGLILDASGRFSTSTLVTGRVYAADYGAPTPAQLTQAIADLEKAVADATSGAGPSTAEVGGGAIGGLTLAPGSYTWTTPLSASADVVLSGGAEDTWILKTSGTFGVATGVKVLLAGGAQSKNVFWQVAGQVTLGTGSQTKGSILGGTAIAMMTGARLDGHALAQTAVTLDANVVTAT